MKYMRKLLEKFCPEMSETGITDLLYTFYPFMFGIYPYTSVTDKQRTAMEAAEVDYIYQSIYELTYSCLLRLLCR